MNVYVYIELYWLIGNFTRCYAENRAISSSHVQECRYWFLISINACSRVLRMRYFFPFQRIFITEMIDSSIFVRCVKIKRLSRQWHMFRRSYYNVVKLMITRCKWEENYLLRISSVFPFQSCTTLDARLENSLNEVTRRKHFPTHVVSGSQSALFIVEYVIKPSK